MAADSKRITIRVTSEMEPQLNKIKNDYFSNCSNSEMIRMLIETGLNSIEKTEKIK